MVEQSQNKHCVRCYSEVVEWKTTLIVVLFIPLIIIGASFIGY
ncbi:YjcZ family sporulation protein [Neobacillus drentensis]